MTGLQVGVACAGVALCCGLLILALLLNGRKPPPDDGTC